MRSAEYAYVSDDDNDLGICAIRVLVYRTRKVAAISRCQRIKAGLACGPIVAIPHPKKAGKRPS